MNERSTSADVHYRRNNGENRCAATESAAPRTYVCSCGDSAVWVITVEAPSVLTGVLAACDGCATAYRTAPDMLLTAAMRLADCAVSFRPLPQVVTL